MATTSVFEHLALPYMNELFRTAVYCLRDRDAAEDCVQETYLQAQKSFHRFEVGTNCRAWLFKILMHVIQHHRRKWFRMCPVDMDLILGMTPAPDSTPDELTDEDILGALETLPQSFRDVVLLAHVQEFSYREIAEMLRMPIGTVMSRLSRGRALLRAHLSERFGFTASSRAAAAM